MLLLTVSFKSDAGDAPSTDNANLNKTQSRFSKVKSFFSKCIVGLGGCCCNSEMWFCLLSIIAILVGIPLIGGLGWVFYDL